MHSDSKTIDTMLDIYSQGLIPLRFDHIMGMRQLTPYDGHVHHLLLVPPLPLLRLHPRTRSSKLLLTRHIHNHKVAHILLQCTFDGTTLTTILWLLSKQLSAMITSSLTARKLLLERIDTTACCEGDDAAAASSMIRVRVARLELGRLASECRVGVGLLLVTPQCQFFTPK